MEAVKKLADVLEKAWAAVSREIPKTPLPFWSESVFRFYVIQALLREKSDWLCQKEWRSVDLLVEKDGVRVPIEFKFYVHSSCSDGPVTWRKGGPSMKNYREFCECVKKLKSFGRESPPTSSHGKIAHRLLLLVYEHRSSHKTTKYADYYDREHSGLRLERSLSPIPCGDTGELRCCLYEVVPAEL
jgi:hypothetical protein